MSKYDIRPDFECQNRILNVIRPDFESLNRILSVKKDSRPKFECQNIVLNVTIRYLARFRMSK